MITINGVELPTPSDYRVGINDIVKAERNARGRMIIERITTKRKLELSWKYLTENQLSLVLGAVSPITFTVTYPDPTGGRQSASFYSGDKSIGAMDFLNGVIRWKDIKFNLIEL